MNLSTPSSSNPILPNIIAVNSLCVFLLGGFLIYTYISSHRTWLFSFDFTKHEVTERSLFYNLPPHPRLKVWSCFHDNTNSLLLIAIGTLQFVYPFRILRFLPVVLRAWATQHQSSSRTLFRCWYISAPLGTFPPAGLPISDIQSPDPGPQQLSLPRIQPKSDEVSVSHHGLIMRKQPPGTVPGWCLKWKCHHAKAVSIYQLWNDRFSWIFLFIWHLNCQSQCKHWFLL